MTSNHKLIFWDLGTYSKIGVKPLPSNTNYNLRQKLPMLIKNDGVLHIMEFKELNVVEQIEFNACVLSHKRRLIFIGMKNGKLGSIDLESFNILNQTTFEGISEIVDLRLNLNHKKLYVAAGNGMLM